MSVPAVRLYVGGQPATVDGERVVLGGDRCFTAAHSPYAGYAPAMAYLLDSGAFSDPWQKRLTPETALERQRRWEARAAERWGTPHLPQAIVSYDLLIDEVWINGARHKRRWSVADAERAVVDTVAAAAYLASQRTHLEPRRIVLSCQGVDAGQYVECVAEVSRLAQPGDWIGFGGWCILGRWQSWLPEFRRAMDRALPHVADAGVERVHIFGVLWEPALAALLWHADQHGLIVSTDSTAPMLAPMRFKRDPRKAGLRAPTWRGNVAWWLAHLANLRSSRYYRPPMRDLHTRQASLWETGALV